MVKLQKTVHLNVSRTLADGRKIKVGELAENRQGIFFAYDDHYCKHFPNLSLSPFKLRFEQGLQLAPKEPHNGLHGVFADSLPDGWGMLLQDRFFAANGIDFYCISPLDRLAFVGEKGIGALSFEPQTENSTEEVSLTELGKNAEQLFDGQTEEV
ncbi:HipA N-terminal domain-containing protein [Mannheimia indoligenes]|uniref:HipA N-terminal domain-containing protein n=1 Tax=Mannheimia indoligenes TaxID=3103145 RepID=UPI003D16444D